MSTQRPYAPRENPDEAEPDAGVLAELEGEADLDFNTDDLYDWDSAAFDDLEDDEDFPDDGTEY